ncbi:hypothetical protein F4604DRAFT_1941151 [Suillus subluteus]|nr:hypothetical protein F4604DRAFT_1941151 [Suillus subluteus]
MDDKGRMHSPVAKGESDGDGDDENPKARPTKKPSATTTSVTDLSSQGAAKGQTNAEDIDWSDDQPVPKTLGKGVRGHEDQPTASHHQSLSTATKTIISAPQVSEASDDESSSCITSHWSTQASHGNRALGPNTTGRGMETHRGLEHLSESPRVQEPALRRTRAARDASLVVQERRPKNVPAPRERSPRKSKAAGLAAIVPSDAPAKGTRSNAENLRATRTRQKPKKYADYI